MAAPDQPECAIDDFGPVPIVTPQSSAELGELVRRAGADGHAVYPLGGQTMLSLGLPPSQPGVAVDLRRLSQVVDYPARDMTVTVQAGITIARLREMLASEHQRLPVDVPNAERATLGGALATNSSGPRRFGFGSLRDYVIGISVINDEGQDVKAGGRVVKNVAGYDLCKLFIGSLGTLGIIHQVTLKLRPAPEETALVTIGCDTETVGLILDQLHGARTRPVCIDLLNASAAQLARGHSDAALPEAAWVVVVGFEDNREAVTWQVQQLIKDLAGRAPRSVDVSVGHTANSIWQALVEFPASTDGVLTFKANVVPSATAAFCQRAMSLHAGMQLQAHAGNGIIVGHAPPGLSFDMAQQMIGKLQETAVAGQGNLVLLRCPTEWKKSLPVWGRPRGDWWLMRAVKERLDPKRRFNPGRFVDGI